MLASWLQLQDVCNASAPFLHVDTPSLADGTGAGQSPITFADATLFAAHNAAVLRTIFSSASAFQSTFSVLQRQTTHTFVPITFPELQRVASLHITFHHSSKYLSLWHTLNQAQCRNL
jgi:hypothetical protein